MGRCKRCKWWTAEEEGTIGIPGDNHKPCMHPKVGGGSYNDPARMGEDALNSYESIGTGPEFGCVHFEG